MLVNVSSAEVVRQPSGEIAGISSDRLLETFADFLRIDVANGDASADTIDAYRRNVGHFIDYCASAGISAARVTRDDIKRWRNWMVEVKQYKPATIAQKLTVIRRFYDAAVDRGLVATNPVAGIKPPREKVDPAEKITFMEKGEAENFLAAIPKDGSVKSARDRLMLAVMTLEGTRTVEMHRASIRDVVQQGHNLGIRVEGKRSIRVVPLTPAIAQLLIDYLEIRKASGENLTPDSALFIAVGNRAGGKRLARRGIRKIIDGYLNSTGLKHKPGRTLSAHSLRHTAGTLALRSGADLRQVQDLLGHKDPRTTSIYAHVGDRWQNNPALKLGIEF